MPRVNLTAENKIQNALKADVKVYRHWLDDNKIHLPHLAELVGVTPVAMQRQFRLERLTPETIKAMELLMKGEIK